MSVFDVLPRNAGFTGDGRLAIGGCALAGVTAEFGTPALVVDEHGPRATSAAGAPRPRSASGSRTSWPGTSRQGGARGFGLRTIALPGNMRAVTPHSPDPPSAEEIRVDRNPALDVPPSDRHPEESR